MDHAKLWIYFMFLWRERSSAYQLSTSSTKPTVGENFSFTCTTDQTILTLNKDNMPYCTIVGVENGKCKLDSSCSPSNTYSCNSGIGIYTIHFPGSFITDSLHGSKWRCESPFGIGIPSNEVQLYINIPVTKVAINTKPIDGNPIEIVTGTVQQFECTTDAGRPSSSIQWYISSTNITSSATSQPDVCNPGCNGKVISSSILVYTGIRNDEGKNIYCTALNIESQSVRSQNRTLVILYGPGKVTISPSTQIYTVKEAVGSIGPITCKAEDCKPNCTIKWNRLNTSWVNTDVLHLQNIDRNQTGSYSCTASNVAWSKTSVTINVIVEYSPNRVSISPSTQIYNVTETTGNIGPITCTADCKPDCTMTWSGPNLPDSTTSVLSLTNINRNQAGNYQCTASNSVGNRKSVTITVIVNYGPTYINIYPSHQKYTITELTGNVGPINCTAGCKPHCTMTWNGPNIPKISSSVLNLQNINRNQAGNYQCIATNSVGSMKSVPVIVLVNYGPNEIKIYPSIQTYNVTETTGHIGPITCTADCEPACTMTWRGPHLPDGTTSILNLENIDRNNEGNFQCTAVNIVASLTSAIISITVNYGPNQVNISPSNQNFKITELEGSVGPISCTAYCDPDCALTWSGPNLPAGTTSVLNLTDIDRTQAGNYQCTASNGVGSMKSVTVTVIVNYGPNQVNMYPSNQTYTVIEISEGIGPITCTADCNPDCTMTWSGPNLPSGTSSVLSLININRNQAGNYQCTASNSVGSMKSVTVTVIVNYKPLLDHSRPYSPSLMNAKQHTNLQITSTITANPTPTIYWTFKAESNSNSCNLSTILSNTTTNGFRTTSSIVIDNVQSSNFGEYIMSANNTVGIFSRRFVVTDEESTPASLVYAVCKSTTATVIWKRNFDGVSSFDFYLEYAESGRYKTSEKVALSYTNQVDAFTVTGLIPDRTYNFSVLSVNSLVEFKSQTVECLTDASCLSKEMCQVKDEKSGMFIGGIATLVVGLLILTAAAIYVVRNSFKNKTCKSKYDEYSDVQRSNPAFTDAYATLQADMGLEYIQKNQGVYENLKI